MVAGTLAVKGKSAPVELTVTDIDIKGASVVFIARGTIDRDALGVTMMRGAAARHLSVDITAHTSMAPAVRATGPGRGRPGICVRPAAKSEDHRRWRQARGGLRPTGRRSLTRLIPAPADVRQYPGPRPTIHERE